MKRYTQQEVLSELRRRIETQGLRGFCKHAGMLDPAFVSRVASEKKPLSSRLAEAVGFLLCDQEYVKLSESRFADPAYLKAERSVARAEKSIRRNVNN